MVRNFKKVTVVCTMLMLLTLGSVCFSQGPIKHDTVNFTVNDVQVIFYDGVNYGYKYEFSTDSLALRISVYDEQGVLLDSFDRFHFSSKMFEYDDFEVSNDEVVLSEVGQSRFIGVVNDLYTFEIFHFHREGLTNSLIYFDANFKPIRDEIVVLDRNGIIGRQILNTYVQQ